MMTYIQRYMEGECEKVWDELFLQGELSGRESVYSDAILVAKETMRRVEINIKLIKSHLSRLGYRFGLYPDNHTKVYGYTEPHNKPLANIQEKISEIEAFEKIKSIPLSLKFFWKIVGDVNLIGYHPALPRFTDPLVVYSPEPIKYEYEMWRNELFDNNNEEVFKIAISPDIFHKANVSGGESYKILVPNNTIDAILENEKHQTTFINYLRISFKFAGFAGLEDRPESLRSELINIRYKLIQI